MKSLLILSFVVLFTYLVLYICGFLDSIPPRKKNADLMIPAGSLVTAVDRLMSLTDHQLMLLKDDLYAIRSSLEKPLDRSLAQSSFFGKMKSSSGVFRISRNSDEARLPETTSFDTPKQAGMVHHIARYRLIIIQTVLMIMVAILVWI